MPAHVMLHINATACCSSVFSSVLTGVMSLGHLCITCPSVLLLSLCCLGRERGTPGEDSTPKPLPWEFPLCRAAGKRWHEFLGLWKRTEAV